MTKEDYIQAVRTVRPHITMWAKRILKSADDAEDVAQEVLLRLWMMHDQLVDNDNMERLARVITSNLCNNHLRNEARHMTLSIENAHDVATAPADTPLMDAENRQRLQRAATAIPDRYRTILYMRNTEGLSYSDIAAAIGTTESSVRGMMSKARAALIQQLKNY